MGGKKNKRTAHLTVYLIDDIYMFHVKHIEEKKKESKLILIERDMDIMQLYTNSQVCLRYGRNIFSFHFLALTS